MKERVEAAVRIIRDHFEVMTGKPVYIEIRSHDVTPQLADYIANQFHTKAEHESLIPYGGKSVSAKFEIDGAYVCMFYPMEMLKNVLERGRDNDAHQ